MATVISTGLTTVEDGRIPVLASDGVESVARQVLARAARSLDHLAGVLAFAPRVEVKVLSSTDWHAHATFPVYGMPHFADEYTLVVAGEQNDFWLAFVPQVGAWVPAGLERLRAVYGDLDGAWRLGRFFDLLAIHELAHLFHLQADREFPRLWLRELFANLCLHSAMVATEHAALTDLRTFPAVVASIDSMRLDHRSLADFERLYAEVGPVNYGWYQSRLHVAAESLYDLGGNALLRRVWDELPRLDTSVSDTELVKCLDGIHPELAELMINWPS
ncbi:Uncharacterised protein [Nocardia otitidiscaviarum]|uniref:Uncharacterized protein n=1 Tax=Nocardia otitidiscaviarum TaxID=1823 RepID=A0A378YMX6_9NOCA|nr:hypothetical protein [Nocardia otitidiscaviarum]SUA78083.1 Uncharacterised protein [Nocardia otitidiscaviarum]